MCRVRIKKASPGFRSWSWGAMPVMDKGVNGAAS